MSVGQWVLVVAVVAAVGFGAWRRAMDGRFASSSRTAQGAPAVPAATGEEEAGRESGEEGAGEVHVGEDASVRSVLAGTPFADDLGERATFLQFSSAFCAPCRVTRRTLAEVVAVVPGVAHVEVDAELHLDLVRRLDVLRTPTTLVLDAQGCEVTRASGAPTKAQVLAALAQVPQSD